jgi:hypothetical protein
MIRKRAARVAMEAEEGNNCAIAPWIWECSKCSYLGAGDEMSADRRNLNALYSDNRLKLGVPVPISAMAPPRPRRQAIS